MNSLKTLYSRITTLPASVQILESVGVAVTEIGESGEQVRPVTNILNDLAGKWTYLSASQQQNIAVQIAGRNQLSRFLALMNGYDTAVSATTTALNSQGSAVRENQAYMDSYEAKLNKMKNSFTELAQSIGNAFLKSGLNLAIPGIEGLTRGLIKLIDTAGLLPTVFGVAFAVFSKTKMGEGMFNGILEGIKAVTSGAINMGDVAGKAFYSLGKMATGALVTGGIAVAVGLIGMAIEKLVNHYAKLKKEADDLKRTNATMVESFRNSGNSLSEMTERYAELYNKYGEFNKAVSSGAIDPKINTKDYEDYERIVDELANKLPTVIEYTDAQGVAHLKTADAVKEQLDYAKQLSIAQAELETQQIGDKMAESAKGATKAFQELLDVQAKIVDLDINGQLADTFANDDSNVFTKMAKFYTGAYEGGGFLDYITGIGKVKDKQAELAVTEATQAELRQTYLIKEISARNKVQASIADQLTIVKDYGTAYMEAQGHVENLGAKSKAVVQEFSQMNSGYLDAIVDMDLDAEGKTKELEIRASALAEASAHLSDVFNSAYEKGLADIDLSGTITENKVKIEEYGQSFENMISMIPKSMITVDETTGQLNSSVVDLADNFSSLGKVNDGIADKSMTYSQARIALGELGVTGKDADQMIRNFAQSAGNAEIQASLMATTVDESADAMSDLKTATLDVVDALSSITGVSSGNVTALQSYIDGIAQSKSVFGDAYESSELYKDSIAGMATYFGMSEDAVLNNMDSMSLYAEILGSVTEKTDDNGKKTIEVAEMSGQASDIYAQATERMKENGLTLDTNIQMVLGLIPDMAEAFKSVDSIDFSNTKDETAQLATALLTAKEGSDEFKEAMSTLGESYPDLIPIRNMLESFMVQIGEGTASWEDLEKALEGQLEGPEIQALIGKMQEIMGVEDEVKGAHDETKDKLAEPIMVEAKPLGVEETKQRLNDLGIEVGNLDGSEATLHMYSDTDLAQQGLNELTQLAQEIGMTEADIKATMSGAGTVQEQASLIAGKIAEVEEKGRTTNDVLESLGVNNGLGEMNTSIQGTKTELENMNQAVADSQSNIKAQIDELNGAFNNLDLGVAQVTGLKDILGQLSGATEQARNDVINATGMINTDMMNVKGNADDAIASMSHMNNAFKELATAVTSSGSSLDTFRASTLGIVGNIGQIASSAQSARDAMGGYSQGLISASVQGESAISVSQRLIASKLSEGRTFLAVQQNVTQASNSYTAMISSAIQASGRIDATNLTIGRSIIRLATTYKTQTQAIANAMGQASSAVSSRTSSMNSMHSSQISRLHALGSAARDAQSKISNLNGTFATAMRNMTSFIARAESTARTAVRTQTAVQNMKQATSGGIVGAVSGVLFGRGINDIVTAIREDSDTPVSVNLGAMHQGNIGDTGALSANAGEATSVSGLGGTSGTIQPVVSLSSYHNADGGLTFSASANNDEKHEDAYKIDAYDRQYSAIAEAMNKVEGAMKRVSQESAKYRGNLQDIINLESKRLGLVNRELASEKSRKTSIEKQLKQLPAVGRQTVAQRKKYNELQKQYDETLSSISSLTKTQEDLKNSAIENQRKQFESLINEIVSSYDKAINAVKAKLEDIDFKIDLLGYTDPDNVAKQTQLLVQKQTELMKQESHLRNMEKALTSQYNSAKSKYGANDERTLLAKKELDDATSALRSVTLEVKKAEKEIKDIRKDVATDGISKLKDYYGNMKSMASDAIKAEQKALEDAHAKREKLYDKEISKIEEVYDAKIKSMDDEDKQNEYNEQMAELEADRAEIQRQIASASRDTSLQGKKNLKELQDSLAETNKEIADAQKARQKELLKEQMEAEKDAQIKAIEDAKALDEKQTDARVEELEEQATISDKFYDDILNDEKFWDTMQKDVINGKFGGLVSELENMYKNIANMNNGVFDGLLSEFSSFSDEAKKEFGDLNAILLKNMQYSGGTNSANVAKQLAGTGTSTGNTTQKVLGTPTWMTGNGSYSAQNVLTSSGTAPAPPKPKPATATSPAQVVKPTIGGTYEVKKDVGAYYTSDDAKAYRSKRGTVKKGTYWIYNIWNGMINVTNKKGAMGSWINPAENKGGITPSGSIVSKSIGQDSARVLEGGETTSGGINIATGALSSMVGGNGGLSARSGDSASVNGAGGTSGLLKASAETTAKIMEQARNIMPNLNIGNVQDSLGSVAVVNGGDTTYHTEINIDKMSGKKKDTENLLSVIDDKMKRIGKG